MTSPVRRGASGFRIAVLTVLACALGALVNPAAAHTDLVSAEPASEAVLSAPPATVTLTFSDDINPQFVAMTVSVDGADPTRITTRTQRSVVTGELPDDRSPGRWTVAYRVVSSDGHPVTGQTSFTVTSAGATPSPDVSDTPSADVSATPSPGVTPSASPAQRTAPPPSAEAGGLGVPAAGLGVIAVVLAAVAGIALLVRRRSGKP